MQEEVTQLRIEYWILLLLAAAAVTRAVAGQWGRVREAELRLELAKELLERQVPPAAVERLAGPSAPETTRAPSRLAYVLPAFQGAALFVAALFAGISLIVYVSTSASPRAARGARLAPESWVVPVSASGEGSCRILLDRNAFANGNVDITAAVIARSGQAGTLRVRIDPEKPYVHSYGPPFVTARLQATGEPGDFTILVTAVDRMNTRANAVFTVQVRPAPVAAPIGQTTEMLGMPTREEQAPRVTESEP
jgi:hypothetical protein